MAALAAVAFPATDGIALARGGREWSTAEAWAKLTGSAHLSKCRADRLLRLIKANKNVSQARELEVRCGHEDKVLDTVQARTRSLLSEGDEIALNSGTQKLRPDSPRWEGEGGDTLISSSVLRRLAKRR